MFAVERRDFACGCFYEAVWSSPDRLETYRHKTCTECFDYLFETIDRVVLDKKQQLTLELASDTSRATE